MLTTIGSLFDFDKNFFDVKPQTFCCKTDVRDDGNAFVLEAELPGFKKEDISLDIDGEILTLTAKHSDEKEEKDKNGRYLRRERTYGSYTRSFDISEIKIDEADAAYENGILTLTLPKKAAEEKKNIRLQIK